MLNLLLCNCSDLPHGVAPQTEHLQSINDFASARERRLAPARLLASIVLAMAKRGWISGVTPQAYIWTYLPLFILQEVNFYNFQAWPPSDPTNKALLLGISFLHVVCGGLYRWDKDLYRNAEWLDIIIGGLSIWWTSTIVSRQERSQSSQTICPFRLLHRQFEDTKPGSRARKVLERDIADFLAVR